MSDVSSLLGNQVYIKLSGNKTFFGLLTDFGQDILVVYDGKKYLYIPWVHVHSIQQDIYLEESVENTNEPSMAEEFDSISYRKILSNAKGMFAEIYVTGNLTFHGYITKVLNDYFVFYSPVYKTMYISLSHLKWLTPYNQNTTPYSLSNENLPVNPSNTPVLRSFEEQIKKSEGKLIVFDGGGDPMKIGLLQKVENNLVELVTANGETIYLKLSHIKSMHLP